MKFPWEMAQSGVSQSLYGMLELCRKSFTDWYKEAHLPCSREIRLPHSPPTSSSDGKEDPPEDRFPSAQLQMPPQTIQNCSMLHQAFHTKRKEGKQSFYFLQEMKRCSKIPSKLKTVGC